MAKSASNFVYKLVVYLKVARCYRYRHLHSADKNTERVLVLDSHDPVAEPL